MLLHNTAILLVLVASVNVSAINPHDEYYANDLFAAIKEAKKRPHHYDYSNAKRYNRSTTQSLNIPRLLNQEMGIARVKSKDSNSVSTPVAPLIEETDNQTAPIQLATPQIDHSSINPPNISRKVRAH